MIYLVPVEQTDKVKMHAPNFEDGTIEDWLEWHESLALLIKQKELGNDGPKLFRLLRMLLAGDTLEQMESLHSNLEADENEYEDDDDDANDAINTVANFNKVLEELTRTIIPTKYSNTTRKFLHSIKKPREMKVEAFKARVKKINEYLRFMPDY